MKYYEVINKNNGGILFIGSKTECEAFVKGMRAALDSEYNVYYKCEIKSY